MSKYLSTKEINELRQLRIIRADTNDLYQRMVDTYIEMKADVHVLEDENADLTVELDDLSTQNADLQDELLHVRNLHEKIVEQNAKLKRAARAYINVLKAEEILIKDEVGDYDINL